MYLCFKVAWKPGRQEEVLQCLPTGLFGGPYARQMRSGWMGRA